VVASILCLFCFEDVERDCSSVGSVHLLDGFDEILVWMETIDSLRCSLVELIELAELVELGGLWQTRMPSGHGILSWLLWRSRSSIAS
jgi:hypothetical protein